MMKKPLVEERQGRFMMGYSGNEILATLAARMKRKAKDPGKWASPGNISGAGSVVLKKPQKDDPLIIKGMRISF